MSISTFELFSVGIGPSSSHTNGPMRAAFQFINELEDLNAVSRVGVTLYGSLAFTGRGHGTDKAIVMGLAGEVPETVDPDLIVSRIEEIKKNRRIELQGKHEISFDMELSIIFNFEKMFEQHANAMQFRVLDQSDNPLKTKVYFSIGGGFIVSESEHSESKARVSQPFPFDSAADLIAHCNSNNKSIAEIMLENEKIWRDEATIKKDLLQIAAIMDGCIEKGCHTSGVLEGELSVRRRAPNLYKKLLAMGEPNSNHPQLMNWLNLYAMAVNEENAAGGRVVTAPTNGAAGIIPAVLKYYKKFCPNATEEGVIDFLLTASAIGILYKKNASISGAEMGCQGEVGVACSMAAGALAAVLGGTVNQVENAAEIGMEHNLGLTCDPVGGRVQIPCIERNAMGTVKAVNAAQLALAEDGEHKVSLDMVISTMREIGENMNSIYKETSRGGLAVAVNVVEC